jgi:hypothetical protein
MTESRLQPGCSTAPLSGSEALDLHGMQRVEALEEVIFDVSHL